MGTGDEGKPNEQRHRHIKMRLWVASLCFYTFCFVFCEILRFIVEKTIEERRFGGKHHKLLVSLIYEITLIELINAFLLRNAAADPCSLFYDYVKGRHSIFNLSLLLSVQFVGGYSSFLIARQFFSLGLHWAHIDALNEECSADLTVAVLYGSIVEALGLFAGKVAEFVIDEKLLHRNYISLAIATCSALITVLGINLTGMYANPIVAWALTFNCGGVTILGHFIVYWLSPIFAFFASKAAFGDDDEEIDKKEA